MKTTPPQKPRLRHTRTKGTEEQPFGEKCIIEIPRRTTTRGAAIGTPADPEVTARGPRPESWAKQQRRVSLP